MKRMRQIAGFILAVVIIFGLSGCQDKKKEEATDQFNQAVATVKKSNEEIQSSVTNLQNLIDSKNSPLDTKTLDAATTAVTEAKAKIVEIPELPSKTEEIQAATEKLLKSADNKSALSDLQAADDALSKSIKQMQQVTNPKEAFIVERLKGLPNVAGLEAVTEANDPNGQLNKQGGYTSTVYFESDLIDQSQLFGETIIEKGMDGGGAIEVYAAVEDANKRNEYLSAFDGAGPINSGSHTVVGTVVIRTSNKLTGSQQKEMEKNIYNSLIDLK